MSYNVHKASGCTQPVGGTKCPADAWLLMQGTEDPEHRKGYLLKSRSSGRCPQRKRKAQTSAKNTTARSASAQPDERQPQAGTASTTREFLARRHRAEFFKLLVSWVGAHSTPFCSRAPSPTTGPHGDGELHPRSIADNGSSWRRGAVPALHRRQRVLMETGTPTMFSWKLRTSLCCEHVCRQLPEASKSCRTICIRCRASQSTECGKMFGSHFQKNPNIMYSSGETTDIEHEQKRGVEIMSRF